MKYLPLLLLVLLALPAQSQYNIHFTGAQLDSAIARMLRMSDATKLIIALGTPSENYVPKWSAADNNWHARPDSGTGGGGAGTWGSITGSIVAQSDLQNSLGTKADTTRLPSMDSTGIAAGDSNHTRLAIQGGKVVIVSNPVPIQTLFQPLGLDSSGIVVGRIWPLFIGNNELVDTLDILTTGSATSFSFNIYSGTTMGTALDSLLSSPWSVTQVNGKSTKVLTDMRNSGQLYYKNWWLKIITLTSKPDAFALQFKGRRR